MFEGKHRVSVGQRFSGSGHGVLFGKCRCGLVMVGEDEVRQHVEAHGIRMPVLWSRRDGDRRG